MDKIAILNKSAARSVAAKAMALVDSVINPVFEEYQDCEVFGDPMLDPLGEMRDAVLEKYPDAGVAIAEGNQFCVRLDRPELGEVVVCYPFIAHRWEDADGRAGIELTEFGREDAVFVEVKGGPLGWLRVGSERT